MISWIKKRYLTLIAKSFTGHRVSEAYLNRDTSFLRKVYRLGYSHHQRQAIKYLGEIVDQKNFDFLLGELKAVAEIRLRAYIFQATLQLSSDSKIKVKSEDRRYLNQNLTLLTFIGTVSQQPTRSEPGTPISFHHRRTNLLESLAEMKNQFHIY